jgi:hypothetical protein
MATYMKDPDAELDFALDWSKWLLEGETIDSFPVTVEAGLTQPQAASQTGGVVTVWLAGGNPGTTYAVTGRVVTSQGRTDERSIRIHVQHR